MTRADKEQATCLLELEDMCRVIKHTAKQRYAVHSKAMVLLNFKAALRTCEVRTAPRIYQTVQRSATFLTGQSDINPLLGCVILVGAKNQNVTIIDRRESFD